MTDKKIGEVDTLVSFLARPIQELERKVESEKEINHEQIHQILMNMEILASEMESLNKQIKETNNFPIRFETRVSAMENLVKHVLPQGESIKKLLSDTKNYAENIGALKDHERFIEEQAKSFALLKKNSSDYFSVLKEEISDLFQKNDQVKDNLRAVDDENRKAIKSVSEADLDHYKNQEEKIQELYLLIPKLEHKICDLNSKVDSVNKNLLENVQSHFKELCKKYDDLRVQNKEEFESVDKRLGDIEFKIEKDDHNYEKYYKTIEVLEMRCDKLILSIKSLEAKIQ